MSKIIKKAFGDNSHYKLFRYPYDDTQIHEEDTINNEKIVIRWIGNDQEELYFYNNCLTKVKEIEPNLHVYQIDKNKDLVIGWKRKDEAAPRVELTINGVKERVETASNQEVTSSTILHIGDKIHFTSTALSNIQRYNTEAHDPDSITWTKAKTITDYGEIQLNYQKVELISIDQDPKTPFTIVNNSKANIVITNPYDNNKVVHTGDAVFYKHNFFHATMNENYVFDPDNSQFIELVDKSANLYRITDNNPYFNIKYAGKVKIVIQDPSNYNAEYRVADGGLISNNDMLPVGSIIKIRLTRDNVDLKDMPEHTTLVSQTFWNTDDDPYDLRKDYNVKINEEEDLTTITLKPPQPLPSTVFKTNANKYNDKVTVESHINHVTADPLPSDPTWFSQFEVVKISFKGNYGETGYKIDSVQNAIHCGEDYYQANGAECIINISEVSDYKLRILKSTPGATAEECGVYDMEVQNKKYPDGAILSLNKVIRIIPQENFIIDQDRLADLELVDSNMSSYKVTGLHPTVECKQVNAIIHIPDEAHVDVFTVPGNEQIHDNDITQKLNNQLKVISKYPYKLKNNAIAGMEVVDADNGIYKITEYTVTIELEELEFASIDALPADIFKVKTVRTPIQEITTFPNNNTLRITDQFTLEFKNSDDGIKYDVGVTGATLVSGNTYRVESNIVSITAEDKQVTVHIHNSTHVTVTKHPSNTPVVDGDITVKILDILKIVPEEGYKVSTTTGLEADPLNENCYKVKETNVVIDVEIYPFVTIDNLNTDVLAVCTTNNISTVISTFPNSDTIRKTASFYILYKGSNNASTHSIVVTGATLVSGNKYIADEDTVEVKAVPKFTPSKINISGETTGVTVKAADDNRELHDGDTSVNTTQFITIVPKAHWHMKSALLRGLEATSEENKFMVIDREVFIDVEEDQVVTINNLKKALLKVEVGAITLNTFPDYTHLHMDEEFTISFFNASLDPKYDLNVTGAAFISTVGHNHKYKATSSNVIVDAELKPVPATIHITGDANIDVTTVPGGVAIHDGDTSQFVGNKLKIVPKHGYKLKLPLSGIDVEDVSNNIYKITDENVTIEAVLIPFVTINNESTDLLKVVTASVPSEELTVFPCSDKVHEDENFIVSFKLASNATKYDVVVTGATRVAGNIYKATTGNITVKAEAKFPPATIHIIDGDHVDVADATSGRVILDNDTLMFVGDTITVVPKSGYRLKQKVGLELLSKPSKLYKIANASVTIEVEEIPTPPAPPPGSTTHNTILWYLKSLFYGGV